MASGFIKSLVKESVKEALQESAFDQRMLQRIAMEAIAKLAELNHDALMEYLSGNGMDGYFQFPAKVYLARLKGSLSDFAARSGYEVSGNRKSVKDMVEQWSDIAVNLKFMREQGTSQGKYMPLSRTINIFYNKKMLDNLKTKRDYLISVGKEMTAEHVSSFLWAWLKSTLVHELRHAFDEFRTNGQYLNSPETKRFSNEYDGKSWPDRETEKEEFLKVLNAYFRMPHEMWARFSQFVMLMKFRAEDFDATPVGLKSGERGVFHKMRPLDDILKALPGMEGWNALGEKEHRRLIRATINLWNQEQDWVTKANAATRKGEYVMA